MISRQHFFAFRGFFISVALLFVVSVGDLKAQTPDTSKKDNNFTPGTDVSLGLLGQTTFARNPTTFSVYPDWTVVFQKTQATSASAGALATFHDAIKPYLGFNVNFGYTRFTQTDSEGSGYAPGQGTTTPPSGGSFSAGSLDTHMYELTLAYAFDGPRNKRFRTFGQLGGGGLSLSQSMPRSPSSRHAHPWSSESAWNTMSAAISQFAQNIEGSSTKCRTSRSTTAFLSRGFSL